MNQQESSITSLVAAFSRAYHSQFDSPKIFDDYVAKELISQEEYQTIQDNMIQGIAFLIKRLLQSLKAIRKN